LAITVSGCYITNSTLQMKQNLVKQNLTEQNFGKNANLGSFSICSFRALATTLRLELAIVAASDASVAAA
jgi:hypothetical protein